MSVFAGKTIAVQIQARDDLTLKGLASYERDADLGAVLRIDLSESPGDAATTIIIQECEWSGTFAPDEQHGCDYIVKLAAQPSSA